MSVNSTSPDFKANAARALNDAQLQKALGNVKQGFIEKRRKATASLPEFEALRDSARDIKNHTLDHLDLDLDLHFNDVDLDHLDLDRSLGLELRLGLGHRRWAPGEGQRVIGDRRVRRRRRRGRRRCR